MPLRSARRGRSLAPAALLPLVVGLALVALTPVPAGAASMPLRFQGDVASVEGDSPFGGESAPEELAGSFQYPASVDSGDGSVALPFPELPPNVPFAEAGPLRIGAGEGAMLELGAATLALYDGLYEDAEAGIAGADALVVAGTVFGLGSGGVSTIRVSLRLVDPSATALSGSALPAALPPLEDFALREVELSRSRSFCPGGGRPSTPDDFCDLDDYVHVTDYRVVAGVDRLEPVPEPTTALLLAAGLAGLGARRRASAVRAG